MKDMPILKEHELQELKLQYLFSNTPSYLFKMFVQSSGVKRLADQFHSMALISSFLINISSKIETLDTLINSYAVLSALSFKEYREICDFLARGDEYQLDWAKEICELIKSKNRLEIIKNIDYVHNVNVSPISNVEESTSVSTNYYHKHKTIIDGDPK